MKKIGIFDSGVGGLGIFEEIRKILPNESIIYLADNANCPYGEKKIEEIKKICKQNTEFLIDMGAKIIVVACNSASVTSLNYLRSEFPSIPIVGVVPVVKTAAKITKKKRIGILATKATIQSDYFKGLVKEFCYGIRVSYEQAGELVQIVEELYMEKNIDIEKKVKRYINPLLFEGVDVIVLGCTHFPFLKSYISKICNDKVEILDSNGAVARQVKRILENNKYLENTNSKYEFFTTREKGIFKLQLRKLLNIESDNIKLLKWTN